MQKYKQMFSCSKYFTQNYLYLFVIKILLIVSISLLAIPLVAQQQTSKADPVDAKQVKRGQMIYKRFCSICHGINLQGQPDWRHRKSNGRLPAPPHDETGHTWHHADDILFGMIKKGLVPPYAPANYKSDMPAWESTLKDQDIWAVLAYIKSRWSAEARKFQEEANQK